MNNKVRQEVSDEAYVLINNYAQIESKNTLVVFTSNPFNILNNQHNIDAIVNLKPVNQYRYINKLFIAVNEKLNNDNIDQPSSVNKTRGTYKKKINSINTNDTPENPCVVNVNQYFTNQVPYYVI